MAKKEKQPVHHVQMTDGKRAIIRQLLQEYDIETTEDIQNALKDLLGGTIKEMMEAEMDEHLGYERSERIDRTEQTDYRNGTKSKQVNTSYGAMTIDVSQDRESTFEPKLVKKRQKDISSIDQKIISMYAKGMTTRQILETIQDLYGFETSESFISDVTDKLLPQIEEWQNRPLDEIYPILYIDAIHYSVRDNGVIRKMAAYVILGIKVDGRKDELIQLNNVSFAFPGKPVFNNLSCKLTSGKLYYLFGPSGCGKSTLLSVMAGLLPVSSGQVLINGKLLSSSDKKNNRNEMKEIRKKIGYMDQHAERSLFCGTVWEDTVFGLKNFGVSGSEMKAMGEKALLRVGILKTLWDRPPHQLSIGEQRKAALAGVIAYDPEILLLDDPYSELDEKGIQSVNKLIVDFLRENRTVVITGTEGQDV